MQNNSQYIAALIKKQWIRDEYVATDLLTLDVLDEDFVGGYKPMILTMESLRELLIDSISFIDLGDTPDAYIGASGQIAAVNAEEDGLIFIDYIDTFLELMDTPIDYTGSAGYQVVVNGTEDGLEFIPQPVIPVLTPHYEARLEFAGAVNPTVNQLLENTLGVTIAWNNTAVGTYQGTFSAVVDPDKLHVHLGTSSSGTFYVSAYDANYIQILHRDFAGAPSDPTSLVPIEIKLYP